METVERYTAPALGPVVVGQHSMDRMRVPGDSHQDDVQPVRTQTPRVGAGQVGAVLGVEGPFQTGILRGVGRLGTHRPVVVASGIGGRPRPRSPAAHTNLPCHLNPFEPTPPLEAPGCWIQSLIIVQQLMGSLCMPSMDTAPSHPKQPRAHDSQWGTALRRRVVTPKVSDHKLWTHCTYKAPDSEGQQGPGRQQTPQQLVA